MVCPMCPIEGARVQKINKSETDRPIRRLNAKGWRTHSILMIRYARPVGGGMDISPCEIILHHIGEENQSILFLAWLSKTLSWFAHTACPSMERNSFPEVGVGRSKAGKSEAALDSPMPAPTASRAKLTRGRM